MTTDPIRDKRKLKALGEYWLKLRNFRNYLLIVLGVCTALRISDLLRLRWTDVYDFDAGEFRTHITITERKTGKERMIALNNKALHALRLCFENSKRGAFLFANNRRDAAPICRSQAWRIIKEAAEAVKVAGITGCHSLRKSLGYFAWKAGVPPALLMDLYGHSSWEVTKRYLGIAQDDRDQVYLTLELFGTV